MSRKARLAYPVRDGDAWTFHDLMGGSAISAREWDLLVLNRRDYFLHMLEVPRSGEQEIRAMLGYRMKAFHPGEPENLIHDYAIVREGKSLLLAVVVLTREMKELYDGVLNGRPLVALFQVPDQRALSKHAGNLALVLDCGHQKETLLYENGVFLDSPIKGKWRKKGEPDQGREAISLASVPVRKKIRSLFSRGGSVSAGGLALRTFNVTALIAVLVLFVAIQWVGVDNARKTFERDKKTYDDLSAKALEITNLHREIDNLKKEIRTTGDDTTPDMFHFLVEVSRLVDSGSIIDELSIEGREIRIKFRSTDPIGLIDRFDKSDKFIDIVPSVIVPVGGSSHKTFTIKGVYRG